MFEIVDPFFNFFFIAVPGSIDRSRCRTVSSIEFRRMQQRSETTGRVMYRGRFSSRVIRLAAIKRDIRGYGRLDFVC